MLHPDFHLLIIPLWFTNKYDVLYGLFVKQFAENMSQDINVSVLYVFFDKTIKKKKIEVIKYNSLTEFIVYLPENHRFLKFFRKQFAYYSLFKTIEKQQGKVNYIHLQVVNISSIFAYFKKVFSGIPYIITEHWSKYYSQPQKAGFWLKKIFKNANHRIVVSNSLKNRMPLWNLDFDYSVIPNGVDENIFTTSEKTIKTNKFVHISCFDDTSKNITGIIEAVNILKEKRVDFKLHLIGSGFDFNKIIKVSDDYQLTNKFIIFEGELSSQEIVPHLQNSKALIMNSRYETFGTPIAEALMCGCKVISTKVGLLHDYSFNEEMVSICEQENAYDLADLMDKTLNETNYISSSEIRKFALEHFSNKVVREKYKKILIY